MTDRSMWPKWWQYCPNCSHLAEEVKSDIPDEVRIWCESCGTHFIYSKDEVSGK